MKEPPAPLNLDPKAVEQGRAPPKTEDGGILENFVNMANKAFPQASAVARMNAENLNTALEESGVVEKINSEVNTDINK